LILPAKAGVYLPPKPAIVKPENIEFSKHMLLGMPFTLGMLPGKSLPPYYIGAGGQSSSANATSRTWSHTTTADTTCVVVGTQVGNNAGNANVTGVTFNGVAMTQVQKSASSAINGQGGLWVIFNPPIGTYNIVMSASNGDRGISGSSANFGGCSAVHASANSSAATNDLITTTFTSTAAGLVVGNKHIGGDNGTLHTVSMTDPSGGALILANRFTSNSFAKYQGLFYSPNIQAAGSVRFTTDVTAGTIAASTQQAMVLT
jgi:hypothetical protein